MCLFTYSGVQHLLFCVFLRLVYPILPVSLGFSSSCVPYIASFSVFFFVLCTLYCQFLCVFLRLVYPILPVSLCFSSSCVPYIASFSVFFFVLCTLYCQFLWVFLRPVYPILPVSLGCPFLIAPSVFSNVYLLHQLNLQCVHHSCPVTSVIYQNHVAFY